ncbi:acyl carrier protein [Methylorubrum zatmanii]
MTDWGFAQTPRGLAETASDERHFRTLRPDAAVQAAGDRPLRGPSPDGLLDRILIRHEDPRQMSKVPEILAQIRPETDFAQSKDFFEDGLLDSFDLVTLVSELDKTYGISIDGMQIVPENFNTVGAIEALLVRHGITP